MDHGEFVEHYGEQPSYTQLAGILRAAIARGDYPVGSLLPSIRELSRAHRLAPGTVRHGLSVLVEEQLIRNVPGRGAVVLAKPAKGSK